MNIFINKKEWQNFTSQQMEEFENEIFNYYRNKGFPYFDLCIEKRYEIFNKLMNFSSNSLLKENNILSQNMLGLNLANYYMPHIWEIQSGNFMTPMQVFKDDNRFKLAIKKRIKLGDNISNSGIRKILSMYSGAHKVSNFRPTVAKYIYDNYSGEGDVIDFSSGFGGRPLGAFASNKVKFYFGFEPAQKTYEYLFKMGLELKNKTFVLLDLPFEDSKLQNNGFDLVFSSPPYFDTEKYSNELTQSYLKYPSKEQWKNGFLTTLIQKSYNYLKFGGYFIINVANVKNYPELEKDTMNLAIKYGFNYIKTYKMTLSNLMKAGFKYEPIFVFRK